MNNFRLTIYHRLLLNIWVRVLHSVGLYGLQDKVTLLISIARKRGTHIVILGWACQERGRLQVVPIEPAGWGACLVVSVANLSVWRNVCIIICQGIAYSLILLLSQLSFIHLKCETFLQAFSHTGCQGCEFSLERRRFLPRLYAAFFSDECSYWA